MLIYRRALLAGVAAIWVTLPTHATCAAEIQTATVREDGLVAELHHPVQGGRRTTVIMLNGSDGGMPSARDADDLARSGYTVLTLAYFKDWQGQPAGLPASLNEIPLEYFFRAIDWLKHQPQTDPRRIVLMGQSRGAELALLLASMRRDVAGVIAFSPSSRVWCGVPSQHGPTTALRAAWTLHGRPVPFQGSAMDGSTSMRQWFERAPPLEAARIRVEKITGPLLLVSSKADGVWPASAYADEITAEAARRPGGARASNLQFDDASHLLMGLGPGVTKLQIPGTKLTFDFGGTPEGTARARQVAWAAAKQFLDELSLPTAAHKPEQEHRSP